MADSNAAKGPPIHTDFPLDTYSEPQKIKNLFSIILEQMWLWLTASPTIPSIIPDQNVDFLIYEIFQVVCVWVVNHVLIGHRVRVA